jgi:hypothetical protein
MWAGFNWLKIGTGGRLSVRDDESFCTASGSELADNYREYKIMKEERGSLRPYLPATRFYSRMIQ